MLPIIPVAHAILQRMPLRVAYTVVTASACGAAIWWCGRSFGWASPWFGALANWCVVTFVAVSASAVRWQLPSTWFNERRWELGGTIYLPLGIGVFGSLVRRTPIRLLSPTLYMHGRRDQLRAVLAATELAEAAHWWAAALALGVLSFAVIRGWWLSAAWLLLFDIVFNVYPALLQRLTRARLNAVLRRIHQNRACN